MRNFHSTKEPGNLKTQVRDYLNGLDYFFMFNQADYNDVLRIIGHIKDNHPKLVKEEPPIRAPLAPNDMTPFTLIEQWLGNIQAILDGPEDKEDNVKVKPKRRGNKQLEEHIKKTQQKLFGNTDPKLIARRIAIDYPEYHKPKPPTITRTMSRMKAKAKEN